MRSCDRVRKILKRAAAEIDLFFGYCPECGGDARKSFGCPVCRNYVGAPPVSQDTLDKWRARWKGLHRG